MRPVSRQFVAFIAETDPTKTATRSGVQIPLPIIFVTAKTAAAHAYSDLDARAQQSALT
jgi:hypothetical protein